LSRKIRIRIAENHDFSSTALDLLRSVAEVDVSPCTLSDLPYIFNEYDVFWFRLGFQINRSLIQSAKRLKVIATPVTGIDHINEQACAEKNIQILCLRGAYDFLKEIRSTAEHTLALTLALLRNLPAATEHTTAGNWQRDLFRGHELYKKKVGIIGFGRLGEITASYFNAFGCEVMYYDVFAKSSAFAKAVPNLIDIAKCDIISLHVNYTPASYHLINHDFFKFCSMSSVFINTSRGAIVDESALLEALQTQRIRGAALDVIQDEFHFTAQNPLARYAFHHRNLLITPHIGGNTFESFDKTEYFLASRLISLFDQLFK
jgi:D-3-phosphoglycerate dehydrogenase